MFVCVSVLCAFALYIHSYDTGSLAGWMVIKRLTFDYMSAAPTATLIEFLNGCLRKSAEQTASVAAASAKQSLAAGCVLMERAAVQHLMGLRMLSGRLVITLGSSQTDDHSMVETIIDLSDGLAAARAGVAAAVAAPETEGTLLFVYCFP